METERTRHQEQETRWDAQRAEEERRLDARAKDLDAQRAESDRQHALLEDQQRQWVATRAEEEDRLAARSEELSSIQAEVDAWRANRHDLDLQWEQRKAALEEQCRALEEQRRALEERSNQWDGQLRAEEDELNAHRQGLDSRQEDLQARELLLEEQQQRWDTQRKEDEDWLASRAEKHESQRIETEALRRALDEDRRQWETKRTEEEHCLATRAEQLELRRTELDAQRREWEEERRGSGRPQAETAEQEAPRRDRDAACRVGDPAPRTGGRARTVGIDAGRSRPPHPDESPGTTSPARGTGRRAPRLGGTVACGSKDRPLGEHSTNRFSNGGTDPSPVRAGSPTAPGGFCASDEKTDLRYGELDRDARALDEDAGMTADSLRMSPWQPMEPMGPAADMGESSTEPGRRLTVSSISMPARAKPHRGKRIPKDRRPRTRRKTISNRSIPTSRNFSHGSAKAPKRSILPRSRLRSRIFLCASNPWAAKAVEDPEPEMFRRRASAVDLQKQSAGLTAMRELANLSTQIALETNNERSLRIAARIKLVIIALGILAGGLLLALGERMHAGDLPFQAALAVFAVSLACIAQYASIVVRLSLKKSKRPSAVSEKQQTVEAMQSDSPSPSIDCPPDLQTDQVSRNEESREQVAFASGGSF